MLTGAELEPGDRTKLVPRPYTVDLKAVLALTL